MQADTIEDVPLIEFDEAALLAFIENRRREHAERMPDEAAAPTLAWCRAAAGRRPDRFLSENDAAGEQFVIRAAACTMPRPAAAPR